MEFLSPEFEAHLIHLVDVINKQHLQDKNILAG